MVDDKTIANNSYRSQIWHLVLSDFLRPDDEGLVRQIPPGEC